MAPQGIDALSVIGHAADLRATDRLWLAVFLRRELDNKWLSAEFAKAELAAENDATVQCVLREAKRNASGFFSQAEIERQGLRLLTERQAVATVKRRVERVERLADLKKQLAPYSYLVWRLQRLQRLLGSPLPELSPRDCELADHWHDGTDVRPDNPFSSHNTMRSARAAEVALKQVYESFFGKVVDCAITQLHGAVNVVGHASWKVCDLVVDGRKIDVKNVRWRCKDDNSREVYAEHTVKKWKSGVVISGAVSPLVRWNNGRPSKTERVTWLGECDAGELAAIAEVPRAIQVNVQTRIGDSYNYLPPWLYDYPPRVHDEIVECWDDVRDLLDRQGERPLANLRRIGFEPLALILGAGLRIESRDSEELGCAGWETLLCKRLQSSVMTRGLRRPRLFIALLDHFLEMLKYKGEEFSPRSYRRILYPKPGEWAITLDTLDPTHSIASLIEALESLWKRRDARLRNNLSTFREFRLQGSGILAGREPSTGRWLTLIAHCHRCSKLPLVFGRNPTCQECGGLICKYRNRDSQSCEACMCNAQRRVE